MHVPISIINLYYRSQKHLIGKSWLNELGFVTKILQKALPEITLHKKRQYVVHHVFKIIETLTASVFLHFSLLWVWESAPAMFRHSPSGSKTEAGKHLSRGWTLLCNTFLYLLERGNVQLSSEGLLWYPYYSRTKSVFLISLFLNTFLSSPVLDWSINSVF